MRSRACQSLLWGVVLVLALPPAPLVRAADPEVDPEIEEIVVTSRRRAERLQDVPASVSVLGAVTLERAGVERVEDFIALTPGVSLVDAAEVGDTQVNIRGINGSRDAENSFAFIVDGILMTNPAAFNRELLDLQQIEILKGPQGALYGRNAAAGAIIVTTRKPTDAFEVRGKATVGSDDTYVSSLMVSGPVLEDSLYFRLNANWRDSDGNFHNRLLDKDAVDDFEAYDVSGRLLWEPTEDLEVDVRVRYGAVDAAAITFNPAFALPQLASAFGDPTLFEDVDSHDMLFQPNVDPDNDQRSFEASTKLDYDLGWATLTGWALYSDIDQNFLADGTSGSFGFFFSEPSCISTTQQLFQAGVTLPPPQILGSTPTPVLFDPAGSLFGPYTPTTCDGYQYQVRDQSDLSLELRLTSPSDQRLRWLGGLYFLNIDREVGVATSIDNGGAIPSGLFNSRTEQLVRDQFDTDVYAVFGQVAYDLTDTVELSLALRYDREEREVSNRVPVGARTQFIDFDGDAVFAGGAPLNPGLDPALNPSLKADGSIPDQDETFDQVEPKLSVSWDIAENATLFGSWGIGFKSGGFNNQGSAATVDAFINNVLATDVRIQDQFDEETSSAFEVGFRASFWDRRVAVEGALYHVDVDDMQFFEFFVGPFGLLRVVTNVDDVQIDGAELGASALLAPGLTLRGALNVTDSEIERNSARPATEGNDSPYTPDYELSLGLEYAAPLPQRVPLLGGLELLVRVDWRIVGPTWFHTMQSNGSPTIFEPLFTAALGDADVSRFLTRGNYDQTERSEYRTLDLRLGFQGERFAVVAFVKNATDEEYLEEVIPAPEFGGSFIHPSARRFSGVEVSFGF